jgi:hypothetical protein
MRPSGRTISSGNRGSAAWPASRLAAIKAAWLAGLPAGWQLWVCGALSTCGATLGLVLALHEMGYHAIPAVRGPAHAAAAFSLGIVLGLWIPRHVIRRRLERGDDGACAAHSGGMGNAGDVEVDFAASLAGALTVVLGLAWAALCVGALLMESYRAVLASRFFHPAWLTQFLLLAPAYVGLALVGITGATVLIALHGWNRLIAAPTGRATGLWTSLSLGALAGTALAGLVSPPRILAWLAPLVIFAAAAIAVLRRSNANGQPIRQPSERTLARDERLALLTAGLAAALIGTALFLSIPIATVTSRRLGAAAAVLAAAAFVGLPVARALARASVPAAFTPLALLLGAVALLVPYGRALPESQHLPLVRLAAVTVCAGTCIALTARRIGQPNRGVQYALSWVGRCVAGGFGLALVLAPTGALRWDAAAVALVVALGAVATAGLALILDSRAKAAFRAVGLIAIALWLFALPLTRTAVADEFRRQEPRWRPAADRSLTHAARALVLADPLRAAYLRPLPPSPDGASLWRFDLTGPPLDAVVLEALVETAGHAPTDAELGRRLLERLATRLVDGGRLLIELPTTAFVAGAIERFDPATIDPTWGGYRLHLRHRSRDCEAVVYGRDIPALIARQQRLSELEMTLVPLTPSRTGRAEAASWP